MRVSARWQDKDRVRYQMARSLLNDASSPLNRRLRRGAQLSLDANYATSGHLPCPPAGNRGDYAPKRKPVSGMRKSPTAVFAANNSDEGLVCDVFWGRVNSCRADRSVSCRVCGAAVALIIVGRNDVHLYYLFF